jgi:hypothetical protein
MKRFGVSAAVFLVLACLAAGSASGQPVPGKRFELGTAVSWYHTSQGWGGVTVDSYTNLNIPLRFGWFVWKGLELEPEVTAIIPLESGDGGVTFYCEFKVVYNFKPAGKLVPFLGGSTGWGNGLPKRGAIAGSGNATTMADGLLAGVKYVIGKRIALRAEYRFGIYSWKDTEAMYKEGGTLHNGNVGVSLFF